jgi:hypothetical protein
LLPQISDGPRRAVVKIAFAQHLLKPSAASKTETDEMNLTRQKVFDLLNDIDRDLKKEGLSARASRSWSGGRRSWPNPIRHKLGLAAVPSSEATLSTPYVGFDFRSVIELLIATDFEQVAAVVERMTAKEVAGVGRIEAAKLYLQKNPEKAAR